MTKTAHRTETAQATGIDVGGIYPLYDISSSMRVGRAWLRSARKAGLKVRRFSNRSFITGADFLRFLESLPAEGDGE